MSYELHLGDCVEIMRALPADSVDAVITSPPYAEQRKTTYGGVPEAQYPEWTVEWMAEAKRLLKPDGSVIINISPHINKGQLSDYVLRTRLALRDAGWNEVDEIVWHKTNAAPTGSPKKPKRSWESLLWYSKHPRMFSDAKAHGNARKPGTAQFGARGMADQQGWDHSIASGCGKIGEIVRVQNVVTLGNDARWARVKHPAPFPSSLAEWCGKLICPPGGTVLDPFSGSASTGVAAIKNGWHYIGIDAVAEYIDMSTQRLQDVTGTHPDA
jgi:DNA modification methylase